MVSAILTVVAAALSAADAEPPLNVLSAYQFPEGTCRVVLQNTANEPAPLGALDVKGPGSENLVWVAAEPDVAPPGGISVVGYKLGADLQPDNCGHVLRGDFGEVAYTVDARPALTVTYAVYVPGEEKVYVYCANQAADTCVVTSAMVNGVPVELARPVTIEPGRKALVCGKWAVRVSGDYAVPFVPVELGVPDRPAAVCVARLFRPEHTVIQPVGSSGDTAACLTHNVSGLKAAATKAISAAAAEPRKLRTLKFCNMDLLGNGPGLFGQLTERNHTEPQLSYPKACYSDACVPVILKAVGDTKAATEPGITFCWVFAYDIHDALRPPFGRVRLRNTMYAMLAAGAKGLELHRPGSDDVDGALARTNNLLLNEVAPLCELVALSEPVELVEPPTPDGVPIRTLLCGDKGILLFVFGRETASGAPTARLTLRAPYALRDEAWNVGAAENLAVSASGEGQAALDVPLENGTQLYFIEAKEQVQP